MGQRTAALNVAQRKTAMLFLGLVHWVLLDVKVTALDGAIRGERPFAPCAWRGAATPPANRVRFPKSGRFSRKFDPGAGAFESGFVPMADPYGGPRRHLAEEGRAAQEDTVRPVAEERWGALGSGHFDVLGGGVFADDEANEIAGARRMGGGAARGRGPQRVLFPDHFEGRVRVAPPIFLRRSSSVRVSRH